MAQYFRETKERLVVIASKNLDFPPHIHEELELVYMRKGSTTAICAEKEYELIQGDFFLAFPEQVHHYYSSRDCEAILVIVNPKHLLRQEDKTPVSAVCHNHDQELITLLELIFQEHQHNHDAAATLPLLTAFLRMLLRYYDLQDDPSKDSATAQIIRYCSSHYHEAISVATVAKALYLSQSHISHTFNEKLKISFPDYVNSLRLDEAVRLLENRDFSIEQITESAGFPTTRTFHRVFRKKYGISPGEYRKSSL